MGSSERLSFLYLHRNKCLEKIKELNQSIRDLNLSTEDENFYKYISRRDALFATMHSINENIQKIHMRDKIDQNIYSRENGRSIELTQAVFAQDELLQKKIISEQQAIRKNLIKRKGIKPYLENI